MLAKTFVCYCLLHTFRDFPTFELTVGLIVVESLTFTVLELRIK